MTYIGNRVHSEFLATNGGPLIACVQHILQRRSLRSS